MNDFTKRLRLMDMDDFIFLSRLTEGKSFTEVSRELGLTQARMTQRMDKLEQDVFTDGPLVEKNGRGVKLTQYGLLVALNARAALQIVRNATEHLH